MGWKTKKRKKKRKKEETREQMSGSLNYGVQSSYRFNIWTLEQGVVTAETEQGKEKNEKKKEKKIKNSKKSTFLT